ncbi:phage minor head protein [Pseudomonas sp. NPDC098747]|uniref:phage head morphogenesis protein n=1 Tax=Pseudomonas sp. NPDC098747 TaxID=3364487 RepID=UPI00383ADB25
MANAALKSRYAQKLKQLNQGMFTSVEWWLTAMYRGRESEVVGDASPAAEAQKLLSKLTRKWKGFYGDRAEGLAKWFINTADTTTTSSLFSSLKEFMPTVKPQMSRRTQNTLTAMTKENVGLIKSIPSKYFEQIEGAVMRAMSNGRDLEALKKDLLSIGGVTDKRADFIARDQANKAASVINRSRQLDLGIKKALWVHTHASKEPRASHLAASGKEFDLEKGMFIDGEWIQPGEEINCTCMAAPVIPGFE